jgi:hypothetical protein
MLKGKKITLEGEKLAQGLKKDTLLFFLSNDKDEP